MRTGRLWQLVAMQGMPSEPSLRAMIRARPDFPIIERPAGGRGYLFDLDAASAFVRANWHDRRTDRVAACRPDSAVTDPAPVLDGTGNLWDLAALPGMPSQPTLRTFIDARSDFPVIQRGGRGRGYLLDLAAASAFVREHWRDNRLVGGDPARAGRSDGLPQGDAQQCLPGLFAASDEDRGEP